MKKFVAAALLSAAFIGGPAYAQTAQPADRAAPAATTNHAAGKMMLKNNWRASKLMGLDVYNEANEKLGDVNELILGKDGKINAVVIGVGGFLGMGEHDIAVSMDKLKFVETPARTSSTAPAGTVRETTTTGTATAPATHDDDNHHDRTQRGCERLDARSRRDERHQGTAEGDAAVQVFRLQLSDQPSAKRYQGPHPGGALFAAMRRVRRALSGDFALHRATSCNLEPPVLSRLVSAATSPPERFATRSGHPPSMQTTERQPFPHRRGLIIVTTLATAYVASHFFRASNVTIGLDLMRDLAIGPEALGALTGAFFFGFSAMQIPCGFLFDHYGPRRTVTGMLVVATIGGVIFTLATSWPVLLTGRVLMGAGFGAMLIGSMVVISRWFPPDRFSTLVAMVLSIGLVGNLLATTPLAWASEAIGWRGVFGFAVAFTAIATVAVWLVVRDAPSGHPFLDRTAEPPRVMLQGLMEMLRNPRLRPILALNFCSYACTFTVQGLWGGPFLREVHGMSAIAAGNVLLGAVITYQFGMLAFGPLDRLLDTRKWIAIGGNLVTISMLATLALASQPAGLAAGRRHPRHGFRLGRQHHGAGAWPRHHPGPADRARHVDAQHRRDARRRLHAEPVRHHRRRLRTAGRRRPLRGRLPRAVRRAHRGADHRGCDLQPLAGRQAQRRNARPAESA